MGLWKSSPFLSPELMDEIGNFRRRPHAKFHVDGCPIHLYRSVRNAELCGDHLVGHPLRKAGGHLFFADGERIPARLLVSAVGACIVVRLALRHGLLDRGKEFLLVDGFRDEVARAVLNGANGHLTGPPLSGHFRGSCT